MARADFLVFLHGPHIDGAERFDGGFHLVQAGGAPAARLPGGNRIAPPPAVSAHILPTAAR